MARRSRRRRWRPRQGQQPPPLTRSPRSAPPLLPLAGAAETPDASQSYHVLLSYSYRPAVPDAAASATAGSSPATPSPAPATGAAASSPPATAGTGTGTGTGAAAAPSTAAPLVVKTKLVGVLGCRIGRHSDNDIVLPVAESGPNSGVDDFQAEVLFDNGKFFLRDLYPSLDKGLWHKLAPLKSDDSTAGNATTATNANANVNAPGALSPPSSYPLYNGDRIKVGLSEFSVVIRSIPPPLSLTAAGSAYEIGTALEANFGIQKEMQARMVCIGNYGGCAQGFCTLSLTALHCGRLD